MQKFITTILSVSLITLAAQFVVPHTSLVVDQVQHTPHVSRIIIADSTISSSKGTGDHTNYIERWESTYGIQIVTDFGYSSVAGYSWKNANAKVHNSEIAFYESLDEELVKYDANFFADAGIKRIYLVDDITTNSGLPVLGFASLTTGDLFYNLDARRADTGLIKGTIHHEIAHMLFHAELGGEMYNLAEWGDAHDHDHTRSGSASYSDGTSFQEAGYVSNYAKTSIAEDMAEVYAFMLTDHYKDDLVLARSDDAVIDAKVAIVEQIIADYEINL